MAEITVIIPLHKLDGEDDITLLKRAFDSVKDSKVIYSCTNDVKAKVVENKIFNENTIFVIDDEDTNLQNLVNIATDYVETEYMSILEYDDFYSDFWFDAVEDYISDGEDIGIYMPLTELVDYKNQDAGPIGYINEVVWASSFSDELGYWDVDSLNNYYTLNFSGSVFKTESFKNSGMLKPSLKLVMWYELLMRMVSLGVRAFVIPKIGYTHIVNRDGSMISDLSKEMSKDEIQGWIDIAKEEYLFKNDRNKVYTKK